MSVPSMKGSMIVTVAEDARKLVQREAISKKELERRLDPAALALLERPIAPALWYDIDAVTQLVLLLWDMEGDRNPEYLLKRGADVMERLLRSGLYPQLEYLKRLDLQKHSDRDARLRAFDRDLRLINTLSASAFNFSHWISRPDPEREGCFLIEITEAEALPETTCWATQGFLNRIMKEMGTTARWQWKQPRPDHIVFWMDHPLDDKGVSDAAPRAADVSHEPTAPRAAAPQAGAPKYGIKGSLFQGIVSEVKRQIAEGQIHASDLESLLTAEDQDLLGQAILPGSWYPIATHDRMLKLLAHKQAAGSKALYWIEGGGQAADQLAALGIYRQFEQRSKGLEDFVGRVLVTLSGAVYNFTSWKWCGSNADHTRFTIEVSDAADFPETCRLRAQGFIERAASRGLETECCVTSRRVPPDKIVFEGELQLGAAES
jgi:hypothetical protein